MSENNKNSEVNQKSITGYFKNMSLDYYLNLFNIDNSIKKQINEQLFSQIKNINLLLILFTIILIGTLIFTGSITSIEVWHKFTENILTIILVGIVFGVFITKNSLKYIPVPPSYIFKTLITSLKSEI